MISFDLTTDMLQSTGIRYDSLELIRYVDYPITDKPDIDVLNPVYTHDNLYLNESSNNILYGEFVELDEGAVLPELKTIGRVKLKIRSISKLSPPIID